ncbi:MAG: sensor histidine kinase, partial [Firmicutes bacterium]|nr:sensor histidine kinase [Bacillota bacterium]
MMFMDKKLLARLDKMLEDGINGTFSESDYDETKLSQLESKWLRYLTSSKLSYQKTTQEREKLKELVSDISHQTKTPIANILLYAELLQEQNLDRQSRQLVDEIRKQSEKLEFLIQSLVKISRLETG